MTARRALRGWVVIGVLLVGLLVTHEILIRWLARHEAGLALFTTGAMPAETAIKWMALFLFVRMTLILVVPSLVVGWLAWWVRGRIGRSRA